MKVSHGLLFGTSNRFPTIGHGLGPGGNGSVDGLKTKNVTRRLNVIRITSSVDKREETKDICCDKAAAEGYGIFLNPIFQLYV